MKKQYILKGLDCPHCSEKIEREVGALDGVFSSSVNLIKQTLTVNVDEKSLESVEKQIRKIVHSHEPEVSVLNTPDGADSDGTRARIFRLAIGALIYLLGMIFMQISKTPMPVWLTVMITAYVILGIDVVLKAIRNIVKGRVFDENFLMSLSTVGAFAIGEYPEAVAIMLFYQIGELFQDMAVRRSRKSISALMSIRPDFATVIRNGENFTVSPTDVSVGEIIIIRPGERVPLDATVIEGSSSLDTTALTGESAPRDVTVGEDILSGSVNLSGVITARTKKPFSESTASKIIELVENASTKKAPAENFITSFARYYTPAVVILAALLAIIPPLLLGGGWSDWIYRGMVFLVVSCPCALVISIPLTFFGGIGAASRHGVLVKGSNYLEALSKVKTVVFDKTGTLTKGTFAVTKIRSEAPYTDEELLEYAAAAEYYSNHPIAKSVIAAYGKNSDKSQIQDYEEISGYGIRVVYKGKAVLSGNERLMEMEKIDFEKCADTGTKIYIAVDEKYVGYILISDEIKEDSRRAIEDLRTLNVEKTVMLTGDGKGVAQRVAKNLEIDEFHANLLPHEKVLLLERLDSDKPKGTALAFVGDGINDAPVLARADVGIAMGGLGSDAAIEAADVVIMTDEPSRLAEAIGIAKATRRIVVQNIVLALGVKAIILALGAFGIAGMWEAVFGDVGVALIAVMNAMRIMKK